MIDKEHQFKSLNKETGLLEDINEVRELAVNLVAFAKMLINHPLISIFLPEAVKIDYVGLLVATESMFKTLSQAEYLRELYRTAGSDLSAAERQIRQYGLSETLSNSHPDVYRGPDLPPLDPNNPVVKKSLLLSEIARREQEALSRNTQPAKPEERVELPLIVEDFLNSLGDTSKES